MELVSQNPFSQIVRIGWINRFRLVEFGHMEVKSFAEHHRTLMLLHNFGRIVWRWWLLDKSDAGSTLQELSWVASFTNYFIYYSCMLMLCFRMCCNHLDVVTILLHLSVVVNHVNQFKTNRLTQKRLRTHWHINLGYIGVTILRWWLAVFPNSWIRWAGGELLPPLRRKKIILWWWCVWFHMAPPSK